MIALRYKFRTIVFDSIEKLKAFEAEIAKRGFVVRRIENDPHTIWYGDIIKEAN